MPRLSDLPLELLLDNLLPCLPVRAVLALGSTDRAFAALCRDDVLWRARLQADFNFSGAGTARTRGWKFIYRGMSRPRAFVWGETSQGRLGLAKREIPRTSMREMGVPYPVEIRIPGKRIVNLVPGGMSFNALDSEGNVYVWGAVDGTQFALDSDGFSEPAKQAATPHRLVLPEATRSITCGRLHTTTLSASLNVYTFLSWGRPYRLVTDALDTRASSPDAPAQVECGWSFSAVLTRGGAVLAWWPFGGDAKRLYDEETARVEARVREGEDALRARATPDGAIPCHVWDLRVDPLRLPPVDVAKLPLLDPRATGESAEAIKADPETRLVKIAALDRMIVGLTNRGHVLKFEHMADELEAKRSRWEYLPYFSEVQKVNENKTFTAPGDESERIEPPKTMHITHISAHFQTFVAYSTGGSSIVLMGSLESAQPKILPALQNRAVISVVLGDYHHGALTASGELYTWGAFSKGALGLGDPADIGLGEPGGFRTQRQRDAARERGPRAVPPEVGVPTRVRFDWGRKPRKTFCFLAAAAGWHMGALVIDLEPETPGAVEDEHVSMPGAFEPAPAPSPIAAPPPTCFPLPSARRAPGAPPNLPPWNPFWVGGPGAEGGPSGSQQ